MSVCESWAAASNMNASISRIAHEDGKWDRGGTWALSSWRPEHWELGSLVLRSWGFCCIPHLCVCSVLRTLMSVSDFLQFMVTHRLFLIHQICLWFLRSFKWIKHSDGSEPWFLYCCNSLWKCCFSDQHFSLKQAEKSQGNIFNWTWFLLST